MRHAHRPVCKAAEDSKVKKVLLISTDKAVRPSNVMGASKRLSELVIQAFADKNKSKTNNDKKQFPIFSLVRFRTFWLILNTLFLFYLILFHSFVILHIIGERIGEKSEARRMMLRNL